MSGQARHDNKKAGRPAGEDQSALAEALESYRLYPLDASLAQLLSDLYRQQGDADKVFRFAAEARQLRELDSAR